MEIENENIEFATIQTQEDANVGSYTLQLVSGGLWSQAVIIHSAIHFQSTHKQGGHLWPMS